MPKGKTNRLQMHSHERLPPVWYIYKQDEKSNNNEPTPRTRCCVMLYDQMQTRRKVNWKFKTATTPPTLNATIIGVA